MGEPNLTCNCLLWCLLSVLIVLYVVHSSHVFHSALVHHIVCTAILNQGKNVFHVDL
jgi:hypothetical protein